MKETRMTKSVDNYISKLPAWQATMARKLAETIFSAAPSLVAEIKWGQPVFESNGPVCYLIGHKNHLTFGFWRGAALLDRDDRLETSGQKMAHMKFTQGADLQTALLSQLVQVAVELNRTRGNPATKRGQTPSTKKKSK